MGDNLKEIYNRFKLFGLSTVPTYFDIIQRYKRSMIGQFLITITIAVLTLGITLIFSIIFGLEAK